MFDLKIGIIEAPFSCLYLSVTVKKTTELGRYKQDNKRDVSVALTRKIFEKKR